MASYQYAGGNRIIDHTVENFSNLYSSQTIAAGGNVQEAVSIPSDELWEVNYVTDVLFRQDPATEFGATTGDYTFEWGHKTFGSQFGQMTAPHDSTMRLSGIDNLKATLDLPEGGVERLQQTTQVFDSSDPLEFRFVNNLDVDYDFSQLQDFRLQFDITKYEI